MPAVLSIFPNGEVSCGYASTKRRDKKTHPLAGINRRYTEDGNAYIEMESRQPECRYAEGYLQVGERYFGPNASIWKVIHIGFGSVSFSVREYGGSPRIVSVAKCTPEKMKSLGLERVSPGTLDIEYSGCASVLSQESEYLGESPPFGLSDAPILEKAKRCKGIGGMSKAMARSIRNAAYLMQQQYGRGRLSFITLTLPRLSRGGLVKVLGSWGQLVSKMIKWMQYHWSSKSSDKFEYVYCTEVQPERLRSRGEFAPHLHMIVLGRGSKRGSGWIFHYKQIRRQWAKLVADCTGEEFDTSALENVQAVKKNAGAYLSKYMSKGNQSMQGAEQFPESEQFSIHWGGIARSLSQKVRRGINKFYGDKDGYLVDRFLELVDDLVDDGILRYWKRGYIPVGASSGSEHERYIKVGCGVLYSPLHCGSLIRLVEYLSY